MVKHRRLLLSAVPLLVILALACTAPLGGAESAAGAGQSSAGKAPTIDHISPVRDSVGGVPARFEWTPVAGADSYSIGVWSEVDRLMWRQHNLETPSAQWPAGIEAEFGTYYWSVVAVKDGRPIADSGRSAFVVR
jgi:hypothetical protein